MNIARLPIACRRSRIALIASWTLVLSSGCYHRTLPATWLDPLSMWRSTAASPARTTPAPEATVSPGWEGEVMPGFATEVTISPANAAAGPIGNPAPVGDTARLSDQQLVANEPQSLAAQQNASIQQTSASQSVQPTTLAIPSPAPLAPATESLVSFAPGGCGLGSCANGSCACNAPPATWCPPGMPQYCVNPQEFLCDGGDKPPEVRVAVDGSPLGLGTQDTVVTYDDRDGNPEVAASNCVCIYAPRFAAVRKVDAAATGERAIAAVGYDRPLAPTPMESRQPGVIVADSQGPRHDRVVRGPDAYRERVQPLPMSGDQSLIVARDILEAFAEVSILAVGQLKHADLPLIETGALAATIWTGRDVVDVMIQEQKASVATVDQTPEELKVYEVRGNGKLRICKVADRTAARVGDTVTFILRVDNVGDAPVNNIVISDNLTTRLEYVPDSQACTKGAIFTATNNEAGSATVSWKLTDDMKVGEGCIIRFRCIVR